MADNESITDEAYFVSIGMRKYGGSFAMSLGVALSYADMENTLKIKQTWPEYWSQYLEFGRKIESSV